MRRYGSLLLLLALLVGAGTADAATRNARLKRFDNCGQLVRYAQRHMTAYKPGGPPGAFEPMPVFTGSPTAEGGPPMPASAPTDSAGGAGDGGDDFSLTNNQEAGVFEPDIVKTDGQLVYAVSAGILHIVSARGTPTEIGSLALDSTGYDDQMLLFKDRLLVTGSTYGETGPGTILRLIDVSNPAAPKLLRTLEVNGTLLAERRTESTVRVVLNSMPAYAIPEPVPVEPDTPSAWVPEGTFKRIATGRTTTRRLVTCRAMRHTKTFSGLETMTVLTIDMLKGLDPVDTDAVMTRGDTVYASGKNLFVATHRYQPGIEERFSGDVPEDTTQIHRFSLDDAENTTYRGSGQVPGYVLNQFAMSEAGDVLRVATTSTPPWFTTDTSSESHVTTLTETGDALVKLGQVSGIGRDERIYAVRFLGEVGYVVTFRQTDPLFTIDLADPANPRVRGELVLPGFSSYLHPIGDGQLIGIGRGADDQTGSNGLQMSLFDVSDLDHPALEHRVTLANGNSEAEYDHHAFLWWAPRDLAVLPASVYNYTEFPMPTTVPSTPASDGPKGRSEIAPGESFNGAIGFTVRTAGIDEAGRVTHDGGTVRRSIVMGDRLITVGDGGLKASKLDDFSDIGFVAFPPVSNPGGGGGVVVDGGSSSPPSP